MKKAVLFLAEGFEEVEAVTPIDYLRRAGIEVVVAGIGGLEIRGAHDMVLRADTVVEGLDGDFDCVVVPGGPGCGNIAASADATRLIRKAWDGGRLVGAICAAPVTVLAPLGILEGKRFTCFMGMEKKVVGARFEAKAVVVDGNLVTSRAAGTAAEFSEALIHALAGPQAARELAERTWQHWVRFD